MNMVRSLEDSLRRMGADYVDRLLIHELLQLVESNEAQTLFEQVERLKQQWKIRSFGVAGPAKSVRALERQTAIDTLQIPLSNAMSEFADSKKFRVAHREIARVLRSGGSLILSSPYCCWFPSYYRFIGIFGITRGRTSSRCWLVTG
jgi:predicted oxidoreductase